MACWCAIFFDVVRYASLRVWQNADNSGIPGPPWSMLYLWMDSRCIRTQVHPQPFLQRHTVVTLINDRYVLHTTALLGKVTSYHTLISGNCRIAAKFCYKSNYCQDGSQGVTRMICGINFDMVYANQNHRNFENKNWPMCCKVNVLKPPPA